MKQNILLVDDHRENLIALEAILEDPARNLIMASNGNEALQMALKYDISLVLLDVQMPDIDGFEVAALMRKNRKTKNVPIIFVTAISKESKYVFKGYECGAVDYLFKPIDQQLLSAKVALFLDMDLQKRKLQQAVVQMKRLKDENERLLRAMGECVVGTNDGGLITFCNDAASYLFGGTREELLGKGLDKLLFRDAEQTLRWAFAESPMVLQCKSGQAWRSNQPLFVHGPGEVKTVSASANSLNLPGEPFSGVVVVVRDVTDQHQMTQEQQAREGRRFSRKKMYKEMVLFDRATGGNIGRLLNISVDGFKLFTRQQLNEGERFQLSVVLPEQIYGVNTLSFSARNVWSEQQDAAGEFHAGFQFDDLSDANRNIIKALLEKY